MLYAMVAIGSTGDVRPYTILAKELIRRGHQARLIAFAPFEKMARDAGMDFVPLPGNMYEYMANLMKPGGSLITFLPEIERSLSGCKEQLMDTVLEGARGADVLTTTFFGAAVYSAAEKLRIPCIQTHYFPLDPNEDFPLFMFPQVNLGKAYIDTTYKLSWLAINMFERRMLTDWRKTQGLEPPPLKPTPVMYIGSHRVPVLYAISPHLLPRPADWDEHIYMTGFWQDTAIAQYQPPKALQAFLDAGDTPVYIGFGSMVSGDMEKFFDKVVSAAADTGLRVILDGGWSAGELPGGSSRYIYRNTDFVNHAWLFPRVRAVVHHGGAGTTATGLCAGRPTLVIPFGGDQPFWGQQVYQKGLGPKPIQRTLLTAPRLADALRDLVCNARYAENAAQMGALMACEDGARAAADIIEKEVANW